MKAKVILLTEIISPYRIPVFNEIAKKMGGQFRVFFMGESEKRRHWKIYKEKIRFDYEVLPGILLQIKGSEPYFFNPTVFYKLCAYSPEVVIVSGYAQLSSFLAFLYAGLFSRRLILWCESNQYSRQYDHPLKAAYKRMFIQNCSEYIVPGKASFEYLVSLGAEKSKIYTAANAVDNDFFSGAAAQSKNRAREFKQFKGYPEKNILYVGRLIEKKGVLDLLKAFQTLSEKRQKIGLILVGDGEGERKFKKLCREENIKNVFFEGFAHQEDLPDYYAASDVLVLPSHSEVWGLVLNEAMASCLPVVSSDTAGAARDLIVNGENGYTYAKQDIGQLVSVLNKILDYGKEQFGARSYEIIQGFSPEKCAAGFLNAITREKL